MPALRGNARAIRFLLDGEVHVVAKLRPTTTVLEYLREHLYRTGSKEGCAEGDCGACMVVLAELMGERVRYRSINSCIRFLPTLDGKALITVESLKKVSGGALHPAQAALVEHHGSQCGFCTPGFVMSLFALRRSTSRPPDTDDMLFALAGNLCRCTGYRPILTAARQMFEREETGWELAERELVEALKSIAVKQEKRLAWAGCHYSAPSNVGELAQCLDESPNALLLAGGTDVGLWVTKQHAVLNDIVYLGNVAELGETRRTDDHLEIGASVTLTDACALILEEYPGFAEIVRRFASAPICNAGTLCGNLANGSPIGDSMPGLIALGASVVINHGARTRTLPLEDLYLGYQRTGLAAGEFLRAVRIPRARATQTFRSYKIAKRFEQDISAVCAAFSVDLAGGRIQIARVAFGGMAATPKRAPECERALTGARWQPASIEKAVQALARDYQPIADMRATAEYRSRVAGNLLHRFYAEVSDPGTATSVWASTGTRQ